MGESKVKMRPCSRCETLIDTRYLSPDDLCNWCITLPPKGNLLTLQTKAVEDDLERRIRMYIEQDFETRIVKILRMVSDKCDTLSDIFSADREPHMAIALESASAEIEDTAIEVDYLIHIAEEE